MREMNVNAEVVVAGGGLAGTFAAISAARMGCKAVLIQDRSVLGGNASSEIYVGISGADCSGYSLARYVRETGLIGEFALEVLCRSATAQGAMPLHSVILWEMARNEPNLALYLNTSLRAAQKDAAGAITAVRACQTSTEREYVFSGRCFIDCTGHGTLGAAAGAEFRMGREGRDEFGEPLAPPLPDGKTMGCTINFRARNMGRPVPFAAPPWAAKFPTDESLPFRHGDLENSRHDDEICGFWWIEYGGVRNCIDEAQEIHDELLRIVYGLWDHMKNTGDHGVANYDLVWVCPVAAPRESRRLIGDILVTENDVRSFADFPDRVAYAGWPIDVHPPEGIYSPEQPCTHVMLPGPWGIPLRCLYSRNVPNLLMAGRDVSMTHAALGSARVMATCAVMGQAVGTAAALCCRHGLTPRQLGQQRIAQLQQQLLRDDCYIPGLANQDGFDLARSAQVAASSEAVLETPEAQDWHAMAQPCAQMFPVSGDRIDNVSLFLESSADEPNNVRLGLRMAANINDFTSDKDIAASEATVAPCHRGWVRFDLNAAVAPDRLYWIHLPVIPQLRWALQHDAPRGTNRAAFCADHWPQWRSFGKSCVEGRRGAFLFRLDPLCHPYAPTNVLSGVNRPEKWTNIWISSAKEPLPQWLDVILKEESPVGRVELTFDDDLDGNIFLPTPWGRLGTGIMPTLLGAYELLASVEDQWRTIVAVADNHQRHRVHSFDPVRTRQIRLRCISTHGHAQAMVYGVRIYGT